MKEFRIFNDKNIASSELIDLWCSVGWGKQENYNPDSITELIRNTTSIIYSRSDSGLLVGAARIFSDLVMTTYVAEIVVRPEYRMKGIGKSIMNELKAVFKDTGIYLDVLPGNENFAEKCGFTKKGNMSVFSRIQT